MRADVTLPFAPAAERNKQAILEVLIDRLSRQGLVLEIGSGTGQHVVHFARAFSGIQWQPSERRQNLPGLNAQVAAANLQNILLPIELDVNFPHWPIKQFTAVVAANVAHIMALSEVQLMLQRVAEGLLCGGQFFLYGPFHRNGQPTSHGNADFDVMLRSADNPDGHHQGIRDDREIFAAAADAGLIVSEDIDMPANNRILVLMKP